MAKDRLTKQANIDVQAREIDFVSRFADSWEHLRDLMGITRPIRKEAGAALKQKKAVVVLQSGSVAEGDEIPYSQASVVEIPYTEMAIEKYAKGVSIEAIKTYGYDTAVGMTDDEFLKELQDVVCGKFYSCLKNGTLTGVYTTYQMALSMAKGLVVNKWKSMHKASTRVVAFVNTLDVYTYLGGASITVQSEFGFDYIRNFMGFDTIFLLGDSDLPRGYVLATPAENLVNYYVDPGMSDFARAGLEFTVEGETNLIGFHTQGNYNTAVSECFAVMGMELFAEYRDGIAVVQYEASGSIGSLTVASAAATDTTGGTKITMSVPTYDNIPDDWTFYFKADASAAPSVSYLDIVDTSSWTKMEWTKSGSNAVMDELKPAGLAASDKATVVALNGAGQAVAKGTIASITVK